MMQRVDKFVGIIFPVRLLLLLILLFLNDISFDFIFLTQLLVILLL